MGSMLSVLLRIILVTFLVTPYFAVSAHADQCSAAARQLVASQANATLLSVQMEAGNNGKTICIVRLKIDSGDGTPPRVVVRRVNP